MITIRQIIPDEISAINDRYKEINFKLSDLAHEYIAIAEIDGKKAGQGRLVFLSDTEAELGGMYVYPEFRGQGVADKIVQHLLQNGKQLKRIYCLPFEHLQKFYRSFGFKECEGDVHPDVREKHEWCLKEYPDNTLLLEIKKPLNGAFKVN